MKSTIQSIVPHAFGDHTGCRETWCRYKKDSSHYCHRDLPYGKDLQGDSLQSALKSPFDEYSTDIVINKLATAANSQRNKSGQCGGLEEPQNSLFTGEVKAMIDCSVLQCFSSKFRLQVHSSNSSIT